MKQRDVGDYFMVAVFVLAAIAMVVLFGWSMYDHAENCVEWYEVCI